MLVPSSGNVAFVLRNFSLFLEIFAKKKERNLNIYIFFSFFYFIFLLQTYFSTINISYFWGRLSYLVNVINIILYFYLE